MSTQGHGRGNSSGIPGRSYHKSAATCAVFHPGRREKHVAAQTSARLQVRMLYVGRLDNGMDQSLDTELAAA